MSHGRLPEPIYVSGPMSYYFDDNYPEFQRACDMLRQRGYDVRSPHEVKFAGSESLTGEEKWQAFMRADIALLLQCKSIVCLADWEFSSGANLEVAIGRALRMRVVPIHLALQT